MIDVIFLRSYVVQTSYILLSAVHSIFFVVRVRQEEELEHLRDELEQQKDDEERAVDKGLMERELEEAKKQACVARSTVEVTQVSAQL